MASRPDGGRGWVIAVAALTCRLIVDGVKYSFGIMFIELVDTFQRSNSETSWIMSIHVGTMCLSGPVVAAFVNRYGCKVVATTGSVLSCAGFIISAFVNSLFVMYATFGLVSGLGFGMMIVPMSVSIVRYFDKHLAFATGIYAMGSGLGTLVFSSVSKVLIDTYTWRGTLIVEAGFVLNGIVCALTLTEPNRIRNYFRSDQKSNPDKNLNIKEPLIETDLRGLETEQKNGFNGVDVSCDDSNNGEVSVSDSKIREDFAKSHLQSTKCYLQETETDIDTVEAVLDSGQDNATVSRRWLSFQPLRNPGFCIFILANILIELAFNTPFAFLPDMMRKAGFQEQEAVWIIFIIGVLSTISRVVIGYIADLPAVNRVKLCNCLVILNGVFVLLCPFCFNYASFVAFAVLFGFTAGSSSSLRGVLIPDLFGVEMIADFIGIEMFFRGLTAFIGLPFAGVLYDITGKYVLPFVVAGLELIASGLLLTSVPYAIKCCSRSKQKARL